MENEINDLIELKAEPEITYAELKNETHSQNPAVKPSSVLNIILFISILVAGGALSILLPKKTESEVEKRPLSQIPLFTWDYLFHGKYTQKLEDYYADNFPFRDGFVSTTGVMKDGFGYRINGIMVYHLNTDPPEKNTGSGPQLQTKINVEKDSSVQNSLSDTTTNDAEVVKSVMIYKGMGIQIFGGTKNSAWAYANLINNYHKSLGNSVKMYCLVIPTPYDFYLPDKYKHVSDAEKKNIAEINSNLDTGITAVDAYSEVEAHQNEYLYFNTDHHWTGRGAYYAYRAFCKSAGFPPYNLSQFHRKVIHHFLGSMYDLTLDSRLKTNIDSVEYFKLPIATKTTVYNSKDLTSFFKSSLMVETARGGNSYSVFLGGDFPLVKIESGVGNGRKLLIIKDSYGNALAPYLAMHYGEVYVVDYRYFDVNLLNFIKDKHITDMIFMHNTFVANARYTAQHEYYLMRKKSNTSLKQTKKDTIGPNKPLHIDSLKLKK